MASPYPYLLRPAVTPARGFGPGNPAGQVAAPVPTAPPSVSAADLLVSYQPTTFTYLLSTIGMGMAAFHGYRRNNSVGWALAWGALGAAFPVITNVIAVAEGYARPIHGGSRLRSARSSR